MTALVSYSTGTVSVAAGGTIVTGVGTIWSGTNARPGDVLQIGNFQSVISDVTDATHLVIPLWGGGAQAGVAYKIWQVSPQRFAGAEAMATVNKLVASLDAREIPVVVGDDETGPDPSLGEEGQTAIQPTTGKVWVMTGGVWVFLGIYKAFRPRGAYDNATTYYYGDVQTTSGTSYIYINETPSAGHAAPDATYWQVLASIGATGPAGASYGGTSTTSRTIGTGSQAFTTQAGLAYQNGARVRATATAGVAGWLEGVVTYSGTTLTITSDKTSGSGTGTAWNFNLVGEPGAAGGVSDFAIAPGGRLTLTSGVPVPGSSVAGASTLYYTPYAGNLCPFWDGANMTPTAFAELSQATSDTTKAPAAIGPEEVWDVLIYNDAGTPRMSRQRWSKTATVTMTIASPCVVTWGGHALRQGDPVIFTTSGALPTGITAGTVYYVGASPGASTFNVSTSFANALAGVHINTSGSQSGTHTGENRTTSRGYTFAMVNGILLNTSAVTNGPAALRGTWVGTIRSNSSGTIDFIFGTAGPVAGAFNVWNAYNRVSVGCTVIDQGAAYQYLSAIVRQARASAANRISFVVGSAEDAIIANYQNVMQNVAAAGAICRGGLGIDMTTAFSANALVYGSGTIGNINAQVIFYPVAGSHFVASVENNDGVTNANTFNLGGAISVSGLSVYMRM
ncbi:hypothetical protein ABIB99_002036 [Bradyrhizobium sp. LA6.1]|uniref:hypothetical protein n=1 Tax=Bradyrhizobium sp. LA6.1 TaxID=3156378 RepID=UPI0033934CE4